MKNLTDKIILPLELVGGDHRKRNMSESVGAELARSGRVANSHEHGCFDEEGLSHVLDVDVMCDRIDLMEGSENLGFEIAWGKATFE